MVAKITSGRTIRGVINYNENKVKTGQARLIKANGFWEDDDSLTFQSKLFRFQELGLQNRRTKTNAIHISLNFSSKDRLDDTLLNRIAEEYMKKIGFSNQPYLVYRHFDAAHPHVHIITTNIKKGGKRIETHNMGRLLSEPARKQIEKRYNLIRAEDQKKQKINMLQSLEKANYGRSETKAAISNIVREVVRSYKYTSLAELNAALRQFNVTAYQGEEGSLMHRKKGLVYSLSDAEGNRKGVPIKASSIYSKPTLINLEEKFKRNKIARKSFKPHLINAVEKSLERATSKEGLRDNLRKKGVRILYRENEAGRLYGVTFVDNVNRCVFNGSTLGKAYTAKSITERLSASPTLKQDILNFTIAQDQERKLSLKPVNPVAVKEMLKEVFKGYYQGEEVVPFALRRKKRKKRRKLNW